MQVSVTSSFNYSSVSQPFKVGGAPENKIIGNYIFKDAIFLLLALNIDNLNFLGEHLWSPEQWLGTTELLPLQRSNSSYPEEGNSKTWRHETWRHETRRPFETSRPFECLIVRLDTITACWSKYGPNRSTFKTNYFQSV